MLLLVGLNKADGVAFFWEYHVSSVHNPKHAQDLDIL